MQENHDFKDDSQIFLCWAFSDNAQDYELDKDVTEDARARKRRIQSELTRALAVLGIKHSTFYSMLNQGKHSQVRKMLKAHLKERCDDLIEKEEEEIKEEFNIHLEVADMTTIHEAYQFLIKKYVDGNEDSSQGLFVDMDELKARHDKKKTLKPEEQDNNAEMPKMSEERRSRRNSFMSMTGIELEDNDQRTVDAQKVAASILDLPEAATKRRGSRRRKSVLLGVAMDSDDNEDLGRRTPQERRKSLLPDSGEDHSRRASMDRRKSLLPALDSGEPSDERRKSIMLDIDSGDEEEPLKRRGSRKYGKKKSSKDKPYPKRKGSFRRFDRQESINENKA